ncbi:transposase [Parerythrobacter jejuensis]|uniref:transposase n=1 Tax=Parerythrobacter jejuensis TaxID=795812 RepID=UPI0018F8BC31|nr:transposase [Parerythrobacter jejuensis]
MPTNLTPEHATRIELGDAIARINRIGFDPTCAESLRHNARTLADLGANAAFLGDVMIDAIKGGHASAATAYGPQAIMLSTPQNGYFLRANIWPSSTDAIFRSSGKSSFVYEVPHDHNFNFLTVGYFGPGYASDYYEYEYEEVAGVRGETAALRFVERSTLTPGKVLHYRAHRDIHTQLPPQSLSVSLNIVEANPALGWFDQYRIDLDRGTIEAALNPSATETFLRCGVAMGHAETCDVATQFARQHPSDRLRLACFDAMALASRDADAIWREAENAGSRLVAGEAYRRRKELAV